MPLNVRRFIASFSLVLFSFVFSYAQTPDSAASAAPSAAEVMRERIAKAKAYIVVRNYNAAIYELENVRRETSDANIHAMLNVLLMHSYLEQTDYKRAQEFLESLHKDLKANKPNAAANFYAVAGQIVKGAKNQIERYRSVGLSVADRNLPLEALVDIEKMRETLEMVAAKTKELGADKKQTDRALPLLEEATTARVALAKDEYDANQWRQAMTDAREMLINSRSTIINAVDAPETPAPNAVATTTPVELQPISTAKPKETAVPGFQPVTNPAAPKSSNAETAKTEKPAEKQVVKTIAAQPKEEVKKPSENASKPDTTAAATNKPKQPPTRSRLVENDEDASKDEKSAQKEEAKPAPETDAAQADAVKNDAPLAVGSLIEHATRRVNPIYPSMAKSMRLTGVVRVEVLIDEEGNVAEIQSTDGPGILQRAAHDAIKKWQFKPFMRDGAPVKASGFVNFNFSL